MSSPARISCSCFCFCFSRWLNNFPSFVSSLQDKHTQLSLGLHNTGVRTRALLFDTWAARSARVWLSTLPPRLSSSIGLMHRCSACLTLMKNNLSKSTVALRQPFLSKCHLQKEGGGGHLVFAHYCAKAMEPRKCPGQLNEAPIVNAMIKFPPGASNNPLLTSPHL